MCGWSFEICAFRFQIWLQGSSLRSLTMSFQFCFEVPDSLHLSESILYALRGAKHHRHTRNSTKFMTKGVEEEKGASWGSCHSLSRRFNTDRRWLLGSRCTLARGSEGCSRWRATINLKLVLFFKNNNKYSGRCCFTFWCCFHIVMVLMLMYIALAMSWLLFYSIWNLSKDLKNGTLWIHVR